MIIISNSDFLDLFDDYFHQFIHHWDPVDSNDLPVTTEIVFLVVDKLPDNLPDYYNVLIYVTGDINDIPDYKCSYYICNENDNNYSNATQSFDKYVNILSMRQTDNQFNNMLKYYEYVRFIESIYLKMNLDSKLTIRGECDICFEDGILVLMVYGDNLTNVQLSGNICETCINHVGDRCPFTRNFINSFIRLNFTRNSIELNIDRYTRTFIHLYYSFMVLGRNDLNHIHNEVYNGMNVLDDLGRLCRTNHKCIDYYCEIMDHLNIPVDRNSIETVAEKYKIRGLSISYPLDNQANEIRPSLSISVPDPDIVRAAINYPAPLSSISVLERFVQLEDVNQDGYIRFIENPDNHVRIMDYSRSYNNPDNHVRIMNIVDP